MSRGKELSRALYEPVSGPDELSALEDRTRGEAARFLAHGIAWIMVSGFLIVINLSTTFFASDVELPGRVWSLFPVLGWGIGVAAHACITLVGNPRAISAQRNLLALRDGLPMPGAPGVNDGPDAEGRRDPAAAAASTARAAAVPMADLLRAAVDGARRQLGQLSSPRLDLEATLEVAEREGLGLVEALDRLERAQGGPAARQADGRRREGLDAERTRLRVSLDRLCVTAANVEVDALLLQAAPRSAFAAEALQTEASLLRAAVEGAQKAREALQSDPSVAGPRGKPLKA